MDSLIETVELVKHFPVEKSILERMFSRTKRFVHAVDNVNLKIARGEVLSLVGESGSGKTTTGKLILKLIEPTSGRIFFNGNEITKTKGESMRVLRKKMQYVYQDPYASLNPKMKIGDAVRHPLEVHELYGKDERRKRALEALSAVGLTPPENYYSLYPHQLSGGQRQRVAIARAMITRPEFVIADEPVSMIDVSLRASILDLMMNLKKELNLTYLFITHDLAVAKYISNRIYIMYLGEIVEVGETKEVFHAPLHPYTKALLSAIPIPKPTREVKPIPIKGEISSTINVPSGCRFHLRCPYAFDRCSNVKPLLKQTKESHQVACLLYD